MGNTKTMKKEVGPKLAVNTTENTYKTTRRIPQYGGCAGACSQHEKNQTKPIDTAEFVRDTTLTRHVHYRTLKKSHV